MPDAAQPAQARSSQMTLREFFEKCPPHQDVAVSDVDVRAGGFEPPSATCEWPFLTLYCDNEHRHETFSPDGLSRVITANSTRDVVVTYACSRCKKYWKTFACCFWLDESKILLARKIGEDPAFGEPLPLRLLSLAGKDRDLLLKAKVAENRGLGIGALTYYRRVVTRQFDRLLDVIIDVAKKTQCPEEHIAKLNAARGRFEFSRTLEDLKDVIPASLHIDGQNPLLLLYGETSEGLHDRTDEECLELAKDVRSVLAELTDKIEHIRKDRREVHDAVKRLSKRRSKRTQGKNTGGKPPASLQT